MTKRQRKNIDKSAENENQEDEQNITNFDRTVRYIRAIVYSTLPLLAVYSYCGEDEQPEPDLVATEAAPLPGTPPVVPGTGLPQPTVPTVPQQSDELFNERLNLYVQKGPGCGPVNAENQAQLRERVPVLMREVWDDKVEGHVISRDEAIAAYEAGTLSKKDIVYLKEIDPYAYVRGDSFKSFEELSRQHCTSMAEVRELVTHTCAGRVMEDCYGPMRMLPVQDTVLTEIENESGLCANASWGFRGAVLQGDVRARSEAACLDKGARYIAKQVISRLKKGKGIKAKYASLEAKALYCATRHPINKDNYIECVRPVCEEAVGAIAARPYLSCHGGGGCFDFKNDDKIDERLKAKGDSLVNHGMGGGKLVLDKHHRVCSPIPKKVFNKRRGENQCIQPEAATNQAPASALDSLPSMGHIRKEGDKIVIDGIAGPMEIPAQQ